MMFRREFGKANVTSLVEQNYELPVTISDAQDMPVLPSVQTMKDMFFTEHLRSYGHVDKDAPVEIMNVRMKTVAPLSQASAQPKGSSGTAEPRFIEEVWFSKEASVQTPVYERETLPTGIVIHGPAIIAQFDTTTIVPPKATLTVDHALNLILEIENV